MNYTDILELKDKAVEIAKARFITYSDVNDYKEGDLSYEVVIKQYCLFVKISYCYNLLTTETIYWKDLGLDK